MDVQKDFEIKNEHEGFNEYRGKSITVIHMFLPDIEANVWFSFKKS